MTKEQIIFSIIIPTSISVVTVIFGIIANIYAQEAIPDKKKLNSYIKKFLFFTFAYILPISLIINSFIVDEFNKLFVFKNLVLVIGVVLTLIITLMTKIVKNQFDTVTALRDYMKLKEGIK